jgi:hypothetical protein
MKYGFQSKWWATFNQWKELGGSVMRRPHNVPRDAERERLGNLPHDILADRVFELIESNDTCDNGGFAYWIDREGFHSASKGFGVTKVVSEKHFSKKSWGKAGYRLLSNTPTTFFC